MIPIMIKSKSATKIYLKFLIQKSHSRGIMLPIVDYLDSHTGKDKYQI